MIIMNTHHPSQQRQNIQDQPEVFRKTLKKKTSVLYPPSAKSSILDILHYRGHFFRLGSILVPPFLKDENPLWTYRYSTNEEKVCWEHYIKTIVLLLWQNIDTEPVSEIGQYARINKTDNANEGCAPKLELGKLATGEGDMK